LHNHYRDSSAFVNVRVSGAPECTGSRHDSSEREGQLHAIDVRCFLLQGKQGTKYRLRQHDK
jgi:hypothetical protein